jgi:hypothetical protein
MMRNIKRLIADTLISWAQFIHHRPMIIGNLYIESAKKVIIGNPYEKMAKS